MPATTAKRGDKWRVVEPGGGLVRNNAGTPVDGDGHNTEEAAKAQARAINTPKAKTSIS
jgi:hypothetical protein